MLGFATFSTATVILRMAHYRGWGGWRRWVGVGGRWVAGGGLLTLAE